MLQQKNKFRNIKLGSYIDYYTENTLEFYDIYDFIICNTLRHAEAFEGHKQMYYIRWGTDVNLFNPVTNNHDKITFFHSVGMSSRKGTDGLVDSYIKSKLYEKSRLIIRTQIPINNVCNYDEKELKKL